MATLQTCLGCGKAIMSDLDEPEGVRMCDECYATKVAPTLTVTDAEKVTILHRIVNSHTYDYIEGVLVDLTTANAIVTVYDNIGPENRLKYAAMPVVRMADIAWKLIAKVGG